MSMPHISAEGLHENTVDFYKMHEKVIESKCSIADKYSGKSTRWPIYVTDIKCTFHSETYKKLNEFLCVAKLSNDWQKWIQRSNKVTNEEAVTIVCKSRKDIDPKYMSWWKKCNRSTQESILYFSEKMMKQNHGVVIKCIKNNYMSMPNGTSCDVSNLVVKRRRRSKVILFPEKVELNVNDVNKLPPFPTDTGFDSTSSAELLNKEWLVRLLKTKKGNFQLLIRYSPPTPQIYRAPNGKGRICGIDLGVCHFATIFDPMYGAIQIDTNTNNLFSHKASPSKLQLQKFDKEMATFHGKLVHFLLKHYALVVVGNLCVEEDDYKRNFNLAQKMKHFNYTAFRNLLIKCAFPREQTGCTVIVVDEFRTSKICSNCNFYCKKWACRGSTFTCKKCKVKLNRDLNAAKNILNTVLIFKKNTAVLQCS